MTDIWTIRARAFGARESEPRVASSRRPVECVSATSSRLLHQILHGPKRRPRKNPLYAVYNGLYTINLWGLIPQSVSESRRREEPQTSAPWTMPSIRFHGWWRRVPAASLAGLRAQRLGPGPLPYTHACVDTTSLSGPYSCTASCPLRHNCIAMRIWRGPSTSARPPVSRAPPLTSAAAGSRQQELKNKRFAIHSNPYKVYNGRQKCPRNVPEPNGGCS